MHINLDNKSPFCLPKMYALSFWDNSRSIMNYYCRKSTDLALEFCEISDVFRAGTNSVSHTRHSCHLSDDVDNFKGS